MSGFKHSTSVSTAGSSGASVENKIKKAITLSIECMDKSLVFRNLYFVRLLHGGEDATEIKVMKA